MGIPRQYRIIEKLNSDFCKSIRDRFPGDEERIRRMSIIEGGQVKMAHLAIYGSQKINGVAELHSNILKNVLFKDFSEMYPDKFVNVTNGVTQRRWLLHCNPLLSEFITKLIGCKWIEDFRVIKELSQHAEDTGVLEEFLQIKKENKKRLMQFLCFQNPVRNFQGRIRFFSDPLEEDALYDVQIKRIHEYKRQLMNVLHALMIYFELKANPESRQIKRQIIFAGKAAAAKEIIRLIYCVARKVNQDVSTNSKLRVIFVENYNVSKAEVLIPAADLSQQISTAGMEASGTGNMKLTMNGALTIGTEDGANIEMHREITDAWWPFSFGCSAEEVKQLQESHEYNPWSVYSQEESVRQALDALKDGRLSETEVEHKTLTNFYNMLLEGQHGAVGDRYFVLKDLMAYYAMQKKVEEFFLDPLKWAKYCMYNIAGMGLFSTDESAHNYARKVWGLEPCPIDPRYLEEVRSVYSDHDRCRIL